MGTAASTSTLHHVPATELDHEPLPAAQIIDGSPTAAVLELEDLGSCGVGIWEMTPGTATDVEAEEVFVVLSGSARIDFQNEDGAVTHTLEVAPGDLVRLREGQHTTWTVHETLRKVYVSV